MKMFEGMLQRDRDEFTRISNRLLSQCFICKKNETTRADYYFIMKHKDKFTEYLSMLGYRLEINEEYGVVQLVNTQNYNRYNMKLFESVILLILRILYDEQKRELSISDEVIINMGDIHEKWPRGAFGPHRRGARRQIPQGCLHRNLWKTLGRT